MGVNKLSILAAAALARIYPFCEEILLKYPPYLHFEVFWEILNQKNYDTLYEAFSKPKVVYRLLKASKERMQVHNILQVLINQDISSNRKKVSTVIAEKLQATLKETDIYDEELYYMCMKIASFLSEAGWFSDSQIIVVELKQYILRFPDTNEKLIFHTYLMLMDVQTKLCDFTDIEKYFNLAEKLIKPEEDHLRTLLYAQNCAYLFTKCDIQMSNIYWFKTLKLLHKTHPYINKGTLIDILSMASRIYLNRKKNILAEALLKQAMCIAVKYFGNSHLKYSDALMSYGNYFMEMDSQKYALSFYTEALHIRRKLFPHSSGTEYTCNYHLGVSLHELAYTLYIQNYDSGGFTEARENAFSASLIFKEILPKFHLTHVSCSRVLALIIEEMAIDHTIDKEKNLDYAYNLLNKAIIVCVSLLGENNTQSAKLFGNLGRLYQSMERYDEAEEMLKKAINIKENILGKNHQDVSLSLGHLAALYNFSMFEYAKAEPLYLRSIEICKAYYGPLFSGLEYDYRGLLHIYVRLQNATKFVDTNTMLSIYCNEKRKKNEELKELKPLSFSESINLTPVLQNSIDSDDFNTCE